MEDDANYRPPTTHLIRTTGPRVAVYAAVTGLAGAIPLPVLDGFMSELARGAAMRRVALRRDVTLTPEARAILAGTGLTRASSSGRGRLVKMVLTAALAPVRLAARAEDAVGTLVAATLLDRYLSRPGRAGGEPLSETEAQLIRGAVEVAFAEAGFDALKSFPVSAYEILQSGFGAAFSPDQEGRAFVERFVDTVLDGLADAPEAWINRLASHFDDAIDAGPLSELEASPNDGAVAAS